MSLQGATAVKGRTEIEEEVRSFSQADWIRLGKVAASYARRVISADDLLQEAFVRALDGSRVCPAHVGAVRFLAEAMRSIADGERDKAARKPALVPIDGSNMACEPVDYPDPAPGVEQRMIDDQHEARIRGDLLSLFDDDPTAKDIVEGEMEGMSAEELRELTGLDSTAYDSKRRLIRRRINKRYPKGLRA